MSARHPSGTRLTTPDLIAGLRNRASKIRPDDAGSAHWLDLAAARLEAQAAEKAPAKKSGVNRRTRRALKSKKSSAALTPAQINGYRPKTKPSTLRGGYGTGR